MQSSRVQSSNMFLLDLGISMFLTVFNITEDIINYSCELSETFPAQLHIKKQHKSRKYPSMSLKTETLSTFPFPVYTQYLALTLCLCRNVWHWILIITIKQNLEVIDILHQIGIKTMTLATLSLAVCPISTKNIYWVWGLEEYAQFLPWWPFFAV